MMTKSYIFLLFDSLIYHNRNEVKKSVSLWLKLVYEKKIIKDCDTFNDLRLYDDMHSKFNIFKLI